MGLLKKDADILPDESYANELFTVNNFIKCPSHVTELHEVESPRQMDRTRKILLAACLYWALSYSLFHLIPETFRNLPTVNLLVSGRMEIQVQIF